MPWAGYTWFLDDQFLEDSIPWDTSSLNDPVATGSPTAHPVFDDQDEQDFDDEDRDEPWVVDSGTTFHIFPRKRCR